MSGSCLHLSSRGQKAATILLREKNRESHEMQSLSDKKINT